MLSENSAQDAGEGDKYCAPRLSGSPVRVFSVVPGQGSNAAMRLCHSVVISSRPPAEFVVYACVYTWLETVDLPSTTVFFTPKNLRVSKKKHGSMLKAPVRKKPRNR